MDNPTPDQQNELEQLAKEIFIHTQTHSAERSYQRAKEFLDERNKRRKTTETTEIDHSTVVQLKPEPGTP